MTDQQLKALFAKLLPERVMVTLLSGTFGVASYNWITPDGKQGRSIQDTELLSLCREVELALFMDKGCTDYYDKLEAICERDFDDVKLFWSDARHASWQQRIQAAAEVRGIL